MWSGSSDESGDEGEVPCGLTVVGGILHILEGTTTIPRRGFKGRTDLTEVDLPDTLTSIDSEAFYCCTSLATLDLSNTLTTIGKSAFAGCTSLATLDLPDTLTSIGDRAFDGCTRLATLDLPDTLTSIGAGAFAECTSLATLDLPDTLISIGDSTFYGCTSLATLDLPDTLTSSGRGAFCECTSLVTLDLPDTLTSIGGGAFNGCTSLATLDLPDTLTSIGASTFSGCTSLATLDLPNTLTYIGTKAFAACTSLATLVLPGTLTSIGGGAFAGCSAIAALHLPASVDTVGSSAFCDCTALQTLSMESAKVQFHFLFDECDSPGHIDTLTNYTDDGHFSGCTSLAAISAPNPDHAMATWPHDEMFVYCPKQLPELLAAATAAMQLWYYWHPGQDGHALCLHSARRAVLTVLLVAARLMHRWRASTHSTAEHGQRQRRSRRVALTARQTVLPDLPDELWFCILSFIRRQELGCAVVHELERELEPEANGSGASDTDLEVGAWRTLGPVARCSRCTEMTFCCTCT